MKVQTYTFMTTKGTTDKTHTFINMGRCVDEWNSYNDSEEWEVTGIRPSVLEDIDELFDDEGNKALENNVVSLQR